MLAIGRDARERSGTVPVGTRLASLLAAALGVVFTVASFFPGYMSPDSVWQLQQGRAMRFNDWHPPVMSFLWGVIDRVVPGPAGMLVLHNVMFWAGLSLFVYHLGFERAWAALISRSLFHREGGDPRLSAGLRACFLVIFLAVTSAGANRLLLRSGSSLALQQILIHDLVAVS